MQEAGLLLLDGKLIQQSQQTFVGSLLCAKIRLRYKRVEGTDTGLVFGELAVE